MDSNSENSIQIKIDLYLSDSMSASERLLFEKKIEEDDQLKEAISLQKSIGDVLFTEDWPIIDQKLNKKELDTINDIFQKEEYRKNYENIKIVGQEYSKAGQKKSSIRKWTYFSAAAAILLILVSVFVFPQKNNTKAIYSKYANWDELTSYAEQGSSAQKFTSGEVFYKEKRYQEAIVVFKGYVAHSESSLYSAGLIYLGASYFGLENYDLAIETFDHLANSNAYDRSKGHWYKLLVYLKQEDQLNIRNTIQVILRERNSYNYDKALEISKLIM